MCVWPTHSAEKNYYSTYFNNPPSQPNVIPLPQYRNNNPHPRLSPTECIESAFLSVGALKQVWNGVFRYNVAARGRVWLAVLRSLFCYVMFLMFPSVEALSLPDDAPRACWLAGCFGFIGEMMISGAKTVTRTHHAARIARRLNWGN